MSEIKYQCSWENNYKMSYKNKIHCNLILVQKLHTNNVWNIYIVST